MLKLNVIGWVALILAIIGGLNWGLVGVFNGFNLVAAIFGEMTVLTRIIYAVVGFASLYLLIFLLSTAKLPRAHIPHAPTA